MNNILKEVYTKCLFEISDFVIEPESKEYKACNFKLDGKSILYRNAKITPKKVGLFVTCWKRNENGIIEPFHEDNQIDFYVINTRFEKEFGQFVFPKSVLIKKGIISTKNKEGKRGFRVYPKWDRPESNHAKKTQKWQLDYFYEINNSTDLHRVKELFNGK